MKSSHSVILNEWVKRNKEYLSSGDRGTLVDCASMAASELGFKVSTSALTDLMRSNDIPTRRFSNSSNALVENKVLRRVLAEVVNSGFLPNDFKNSLLARLGREIQAEIFGLRDSPSGTTKRVDSSTRTKWKTCRQLDPSQMVEID